MFKCMAIFYFFCPFRVFYKVKKGGQRAQKGGSTCAKRGVNVCKQKNAPYSRKGFSV